MHSEFASGFCIYLLILHNLHILLFCFYNSFFFFNCIFCLCTSCNCRAAAVQLLPAAWVRTQLYRDTLLASSLATRTYCVTSLNSWPQQGNIRSNSQYMVLFNSQIQLYSSIYNCCTVLQVSIDLWAILIAVLLASCRYNRSAHGTASSP